MRLLSVEPHILLRGCRRDVQLIILSFVFPPYVRGRNFLAGLFYARLYRSPSYYIASGS